MTNLLTEEDAAALCTAQGVPVAPRTLANWRWSGVGPAFIKVRSRVRYRREDVIAWVRAQIGEPMHGSTDDARVLAERRKIQLNRKSGKKRMGS
jgi:hypothetical protein